MGILSAIGDFLGGSLFGTALKVGGLGLSIYSSTQAQRSTQRAAETQAQFTQDYYRREAEEKRRVAEFNAKLSIYDAKVVEEEAKRIEYQTQVKLRMHTESVDALISTQKARYGKSGVSVGRGSPLDVVADTASKGARDAFYIKYNGETAAERSRSLATRYRLLADAGLSQAVMFASNLLETGANQAYGIRQQGDIDATARRNIMYGDILSKSYDIGDDLGLFKTTK